TALIAAAQPAPPVRRPPTAPLLVTGPPVAPPATPDSICVAPRASRTPVSIAAAPRPAPPARRQLTEPPLAMGRSAASPVVSAFTLAAAPAPRITTAHL